MIQILAGGAGDGGPAARQAARHGSGGLAVVVEADAAGDLVASHAEPEANGADSGLPVPSLLAELADNGCAHPRIS